MAQLFQTYTLLDDFKNEVLLYFAGDVVLSARTKALCAAVLTKVAESLGILEKNGVFPVVNSSFEYQFLVLTEAFNGEARKLIKSHAPIPPLRITFEGGLTSAPQEFQPATISAKLDLNLITQAQAEALPGLGPVSSRRMLNYRNAVGLVTDWEELKSETKISSATLEKLQENTYLGSGEFEVVADLPSEEIWMNGFNALLRLVVNNDVVINEIPIDSNPDETFLRLIQVFGDNILRDANYPKGWKPSMERLMRNSNYLNSNVPIAETDSDDIQGVSYLSGSAYIDVLTSLLQNATESIEVSMFYFHVGSLEDPGGLIFSELIAAKARGVNVRVILDNDFEGDYHNARNVNANTFQLLNDHNIEHLTYYGDISNHSKLVIVDKQHVVAGSHNWTTSSFYRYQDNSFYVLSDSFGASVTAYFDALWNMLAVGGVNWELPLEYVECITTEERTLLLGQQISNASELVSKTRTSSQRATLAENSGIDEEQLHIWNDVLSMMKGVKLSETTCYILVANGIRTVSGLKKASQATITEAVQNNANLPNPFKYRSLGESVINHLIALN